MDATPRAALYSPLTPARIRRAPLARSIMWIGGLAATVAAMTVGALLAVVAATAMAVIALIAAMLVFLAGLAFRARRVATAGAPVLEARKVGHAWVAYGWDRTAR